MGIHIFYSTSWLLNIQVTVFKGSAFSQRILKRGFKITSFSKSTFPGLLKNVLTLILGGLKAKCRWPKLLRNGWELSKKRTPDNPKTATCKIIIIFFRSLVVCSGFEKWNTHLPLELPVKFWSPHIYTGFFKQVFEIPQSMWSQ